MKNFPKLSCYKLSYKFSITAFLALTLISFNSYAQIAFNSNTCKRILTGEQQQVCLQAVGGDAKARYQITRLFGDINQTETLNLKYAFYWHLTLARQILKQNLEGNAYNGTLYNTGVMYSEGLGTDANQEKAFFWFEKSAQRNNTLAMLRLSLAYELGLGTTKDANKSLEWLQKAVQLKDPNALIAMAQRLIEGKGAAVNNSQAIEYLEQAAQLGVAQAYFVLGNIYLDGRLVKKDFAEAKQRYGKACAMNMLPACKAYYELDQQDLNALLPQNLYK